MIKGIFVIIDGLGDLPNRQLEDKTPLEVANTKNMDFLATRGELGYMYPVKPMFIPESNEALISIFGNNFTSSTRGRLEADGEDVKMTHGDLALRANFACIDHLKSGNILDRRAGRTLSWSEIEDLSDVLNQIELPCKFEFIPTSQHRALLILRGGFSDNVSGNDSSYQQGKFKELNKVSKCMAKDDDENSQYTVNILNEFLEKAYNVLDKHFVNSDRRRRGLMPANFLLVRGAGVEKPKLKQYRSWFSVTYDPLSKGFSKFSGMRNFSFAYPRLKNIDSYKLFYKGLAKACKLAIKTIKRNSKKAEYVYVHLKETDIPGHDNKPLEKKLMLEYIDKTLMKFLRKFAPYNNVKVVVTGDHSTPCKLKNHSADPVPVLFYNNSIPKEKYFSEKDCRINGTLGRILGPELFEKTFYRKN